MPPHEMLLPVALLAAVFLIHWLYYRRHRDADSQQVIRIEDLTGTSPSVKSGERLTIGCARPAQGTQLLEGAHVALTPDDRIVRLGVMPLGTAERTVADVRRRAYSARALRAADEHYAEALICGDDLLVEGTCVFLAPVKVSGDLIVQGDAVFHAPVVVNGYAKIAGSARFDRGLLIKADAIITGQATIGCFERKGWAIARSLQLDGTLNLNGSVAIEDGLRGRAAA